MKSSYLLSCIPMMTSRQIPIIRNAGCPSCMNCVHFQPYIHNSDFASSSSKCTVFGNKDIITDTISYDYANSCRNDESKCGKEGKYFEQEPNLQAKILKHKFISNFANNLFTLSVIISIFLTAYIKTIS